MSTRHASHAGTWYTSNGSNLDGQLTDFLGAVTPSAEDQYAPPIAGCKAIIAPHAGYSYSGPAAAWAYKSIDVTGIKRVFILGPSHHYYLNGCALSKCQEYQTPIGKLPLDLETIQELRTTENFEDMSLHADENEHSIEMHLPYVRKIFQSQDIKIVPILIGSINRAREAMIGRVLAPYLAREDTFFVISSDFCHWGTRFSYTHYIPSPEASAINLKFADSSLSSLKTHPIHASISVLDHQAMSILALPRSGASKAHEDFSAYLSETKNTICGRHPIGVLLGALTALEAEGKSAVLKWVRYQQSSKCFTIKDSSVSYASAYITF